MLAHFCCCNNLRSGCFVFAWLQLMLIAIIISWMSSVLVIVDRDENFRNIYPPTHIFVSMGITEQVIKSVACFVLIWGIYKKNHFFFQPWLFILSVENTILALSFLGFIIAGFDIVIIIPYVILSIILSGLSWYFWACVYALYKNIKNSSVLSIENVQYESLPLDNTIVLI